MIPILHSPGVMIPGQLGPIKRQSFVARKFLTLSMSRMGIPSVMAIITFTPASAASMMASAQNGGGTNIILVLAPVVLTASATVLNTGTSSIFCPPLPGVTPATTLVPYSIHCLVWNWPSLPVIPCTRTFEFLFTNILTINSLVHK